MTRYLPVLLCIVCLGAGTGASAAAGAEAPISIPGMELVFAGEAAHSDGTLVAVDVTCLGEKDGFCSGMVSLSRAGHSVSIPVSIEGGTSESVYLPLRLGGAAKVRGVASTDQRLGPPSSTKTLLYVH